VVAHLRSADRTVSVVVDIRRGGGGCCARAAKQMSEGGLRLGVAEFESERRGALGQDSLAVQQQLRHLTQRGPQDERRYAKPQRTVQDIRQRTLHLRVG